MANPKQSPEFLGGGPKFNQVGRDNPSAPGAEEPVVPVRQTGYWLRVTAVVVILILLAGLLLYLNDNTLGKTKEPFARGGRVVSPGDKTDVPSDPNFK